jgi:hypothetical protein
VVFNQIDSRILIAAVNDKVARVSIIVYQSLKMNVLDYGSSIICHHQSCI